MIEYMGSLHKDSILFEESNTLVLCGAGNNGKRVLEMLYKTGLSDTVIGFCDINHDLQGQYIYEKRIFSYEEQLSNNKDAIFIITCMDILSVIQIISQVNVRIHIVYL